MKCCIGGWVAACCFAFLSTASGQISVFPYVEHFDTVAAPNLPQGWTGAGFATDSGTAKSGAICVFTKGNLTTKHISTPFLNFSIRLPDKLVFFERRSGSALSYRLELRASFNGVDFGTLLARFDTSTSSTAYILRMVPLSGFGLENQANVKIRWQLIGDSTNNTGTFRIDDVSLTTLVACDLTPGAIYFQPSTATSRDSLIVSVRIRNLGNQTAADYTVNFFCDLNHNSIPELNEHFASAAGLPILASDSAVIVAGHSPLKAGDYKFFAIVALPYDERSENDTISTTLTIGYPKGSLLVNEIMYAPAGDEPEWVEVINCSPDTINLRNWRISDSNVSTKTVISPSDVHIPPSGYCIVAKDANFSTVHPSVSCPVVVTNFSALNNTTPDAVLLFEPRLMCIDSVFYSPGWGGQGGKSLERIDVDQPSSDPGNWGTSRDSTGSTPGRPNSIIRLPNDLVLDRAFQTQAETPMGLVPVMHCVVSNAGKNIASDFSVKLYGDLGHDDGNEPADLIATLGATGLLCAGDSVIFSYSWTSAPQGECAILAVIDFPPDERPSNNRCLFSTRTTYNARSIIVNEIMFDPLANQNEWVELYNRSQETVDLKDWKLRDRPTVSGSVNSFTLAAQSLFVHAGDFVVVAADSTIFSLFPNLANSYTDCHLIVLNESAGLGLGNDGDDVIVRDLLGSTIDSVSYTSSWHRPDVTDTKGRSLEKINPNLDSNSPLNWTTSVLTTGGSPGKNNSTFTTKTPNISTLTFSPNPFSPDGDGFEDFCLIQYDLPLTTALIHVKIFDIKGRLVRTIANSQISSSRGELLWDGLDQNRQRVRIGPYIVLVEATDGNGNATIVVKGVVVVAARL